jgi:hypothetical protein
MNAKGCPATRAALLENSENHEDFLLRFILFQKSSRPRAQMVVDSLEKCITNGAFLTHQQVPVEIENPN